MTYHGAVLAASRSCKVVGEFVSDADGTRVDVDTEEVHVHHRHRRKPENITETHSFEPETTISQSQNLSFR